MAPDTIATLLKATGPIGKMAEDANRIVDTLHSSNPFDEKDTIKVMIGEPSQGHVDVIAHDNRKDMFFEMARLERESKFRFFSGTTGRMMVTFARDTLADEAMKQGCDWVLFIDDDMIVPKKMFTALARHMDHADIIVPLCFQRVHPYKPVIYKTTLHDNDGKPYFDNHHYLDYPPNSVFEVGTAGFGVALVKMEVFRKMPTPWFFSNTSVGEDIYFCIRAKQLGFKILCDSRIKIGHLGVPPCITEWDYLKHNAKELVETRKEEIAAITEKPEGHEPIVRVED